MNTSNLINEKAYWAAQTDFKESNMSLSYLRASVLLSTQNRIEFAVQEAQQGNTNAGLSTDKHLKLNDAFIITHVGLGLSTTTDNTVDANIANMILYTFRNGIQLPTANLEQIYNGDMSIKVDRKDYVPAMPVRDFQRVGTAQSGQLEYATGRDSFENGLYGYYPVGGIAIDGQVTLNWDINLPESLNMGLVAPNANYITLLVKGYLCTNQATSEKLRNNA